MGEARLRGTRDQRVFKAIYHNPTETNLNGISMQHIYETYEVPTSAVALGYVIRIDFLEDETMKFLVSFDNQGERVDFQYSAYPGGAYLFEDMNAELKRMARQVAKTHETDICYLFETNNNFQVIPVVSVDSQIIDIN